MKLKDLLAVLPSPVHPGSKNWQRSVKALGEGASLNSDCCGSPHCSGLQHSFSSPTSTLGKAGNQTVPPGPSLLQDPARKPWPGGKVGWNIIQDTKSFHSWSGHIPRLWVRSPVRACTGGNLSMFLSHIDLSLSLSL